MIKRLHAKRSHGTLVANPRRKRRAGASKRRHKRGLRTLSANPRRAKRSGSGHRAKRRNPSHGLSGFLKKRTTHKRRTSHKRRNPDLSIGGVDLVSVGIGSVAALSLGAIGKGVFDKYLSSSVSSPTLAAAAPSLIVAAGAFAVHKYVKSAKVKEIAKVTLVLSIFKAINDSFGQQIEDGVKNALPSLTGAYIPAVAGRQMAGRSTHGAYIDAATGNAATHGILPGAGLYGL